MKEKNTAKGRSCLRKSHGLPVLLVLAGLLAASVMIMMATGREPKGEPCVGICYRISGGKNEMVVLGSIHVGNESMERYGEHIESALEAADVLVFECNNESAEAKAASDRLTRSASALKDEVSPETYELVEQVARKLNLSMSRFDRMRPWAVTSALSTRIAAGEMGVRDATAALQMGVEEHVRKAAGGKTLDYLETAEAQLTALDQFSPALQEWLLRDACDQALCPRVTSLKDWPDWWRLGDAEAFARAYREENLRADPALMSEYHDALVTRRNKIMAQELARLLESDEPHRYFVTVGLLHLVLPEDSVLWELEQMGYTAERLMGEPADPDGVI